MERSSKTYGGERKELCDSISDWWKLCVLGMFVSLLLRLWTVKYFPAANAFTLYV